MTEQPPPSLSEAELQALCDRIAETERSLLHRFRIAAPKQHSCLETKLKGLQNVLALYDILTSFRKALKEEGEKFRAWIPKGHIVQVVRACCDQRYEEHDIEYIFYKHGDINGLLVLYLCTQRQTRLFSQIYGLPTNLIADLAEQCKKEEINSIYITAWIKDYDRSKTKFDPTKSLPRLYRWGKEKENRGVSSPSVPRKRVRLAAPTKPQTGSDMQTKSTEIDTLPSLEDVPLQFDYQSTAALGLPPPATIQQQQYSPTISDTSPHFGATLPPKQIHSATSTLTGSNLEYMEDDGWAWIETGINYFIPQV